MVLMTDGINYAARVATPNNVFAATKDARLGTI